VTDGRSMAETYAAGYRCPDCDSDAELTELTPAVFSLEVRHDETCPTLRRMADR